MKKYYFYSLIVIVVGFILAIVGAMNDGIKQVGVTQDSLLSKVVILSDHKRVYTKDLPSFKNIKVDTQTADFVIKSGSKYHVKVTDSSNYAVTTKVINNQLVVKEKQRANMVISWGPSQTKVEITVPNRQALKALTGTTQTSKLTLQNLKIASLDLKQDAGRITLHDVQFSHNFKVHSNESRISLYNSQLRNTQVTADELNITATNSKLTGNNSWRTDEGNIKLAAMRNPLTYSVDEAQINYFGQHKHSLRQTAHSVDRLQINTEDPSTVVKIS